MLQSEVELSPRQARKAIAAATIGSGLEFYDFLTYAFFAIQIGRTFFPSDNPYLSLMGSLGAFAAGFIGRPIGAWVLGGYGDRAGRKPAMLLSMLLMGLGIAVLALTPGYSSIGLAAPIIVVIARFVQGFALGGEVGSATVYMVEAGQIDRRGRSASWQGVCQGLSVTLGALVGLVLSLLMTDEQLAAYGWRIALLLGVGIVPAALIMRASLPETHGRTEPDTEGLKPGPSFRQIAVIGMTLMGTATIATYINNYIATYGQTQLHLSVSQSMAGQLSGNVMVIVAALTGGTLCDRFGRRPILIASQLGVGLAAVPVFAVLTASRTAEALIAASIIMHFLVNIGSPALFACIAESLHPAKRTRGFALIYSLPVMAVGGTTQMFVTWLLHVTGNPMSIAYYLSAVACLGVAAAISLPESAPHFRRLPLTHP